MTTLLDIPVVSDADVRRSLRKQIVRLEAELIGLPADARSRATPATRSGARIATSAMGSGARVPSVGELERIRDDLVRRTQESRFEGGEEQERKRRLREEMWVDPRAHRGVTVANAEVGEQGCTRWSSWFRLHVSGGCP